MYVHLHGNNTCVVVKSDAHHIITVLQVLTLECKIIRFIYCARQFNRFHILIRVVAVYIHSSGMLPLLCREILHIQHRCLPRLDGKRQFICNPVSLGKKRHTAYHKRSSSVVSDTVIRFGNLSNRSLAKIKSIFTSQVRAFNHYIITTHSRHHILHRRIAKHCVLWFKAIVTTVAVKFKAERSHHSIVTAHRSII